MNTTPDTQTMTDTDADTAEMDEPDDNTRMVKAEVGEDIHSQLRQIRAEKDSTLQAATETALQEWYREVR